MADAGKVLRGVESKTGAVVTLAAALVLVALTVGALVLLGLAGYVFYNILHFALHHHGRHFQDVVADIINEILLVFIIVELVETAYHQVREGIGGALGKKLVKKLLIIGLLSSVRHLLTIGAELSTNPNGTLHGQRLNDILSALGVSAAIVIGLALVLVVFVNYYPAKDDVDDFVRSGTTANRS